MPKQRAPTTTRPPITPPTMTAVLFDFGLEDSWGVCTGSAVAVVVLLVVDLGMPSGPSVSEEVVGLALLPLVVSCTVAVPPFATHPYSTNDVVE